MKTVEAYITRITLGLGILILCGMMLQIVIDVVMRNTIGHGLPATPEIVSRYSMVALSFLPIAFTEIRRRHIEASLFTDKLPIRYKRFVLLFGYILSFIVYSILTYGTGVEAWVQTRRGAYIESGVTNLAVWPSYWVLPFSFGMMVIVIAIRSWSLFKGNSDFINEDNMANFDKTSAFDETSPIDKASKGEK